MAEMVAGFFMTVGAVALVLDLVILVVLAVAYWTQRRSS